MKIQEKQIKYDYIDSEEQSFEILVYFTDEPNIRCKHMGNGWFNYEKRSEDAQKWVEGDLFKLIKNDAKKEQWEIFAKNMKIDPKSCIFNENLKFN